jgi:Flp pilus assembly protein TadB
VGESFALKLAAFGWTIAALAMTWAIVERRGRKQAEQDRASRDRDSDAAHRERVAGLQEVRRAMRDALDVIDRHSTDD